jgi:hypothetical protein
MTHWGAAFALFLPMRQSMTTREENTMRTHIIGTDLYHGPRHPRANTAYPGSLMVADVETWQKLETEPDYTFPDATGSLGDRKSVV